MFSCFFLTMVTLYILKPVQSALFLEEFGSKNLRYAYLGEGIFNLFVTWAYIQFAKFLPRKKFFRGILLFFIVNLVLFWWLFHIHVRYLSAIFYIWVACFSITIVTHFWTLANDIFDPLEAKRLFGLIISGASAGGVVGGLLTNRAVRWIPTEDLLLISCFLLGGCVYLISRIWSYVPQTAIAPVRGQKTPIESESARKLFFSSPYLWMLAGVVCFAKIGSTVVDNQFKAVVEDYVIGKEAKTAFFGAFSAGLNFISFFMQLYATSLSLRFLGIGTSLLLLPVGLSVGSLATFLFPVLSAATLLKIFDGSMNYSIQQASKEVLYLPLSSRVRYRVKPLIDMLCYRASKSLGGLLIILLAPVFLIPNERIGILVVLLAPLWLFLVWKTKAAYLVLLRHNLRKGKPEGPVPKPRQATEVLSFLYDEKSLDQLRTFLTEESSIARKMAATACLVYHRAGKDLEAVRRLVSGMIRWEALETNSQEGGTAEKESTRQKEFLDQLLLQEAQKQVDPSLPAPSHLPQNPEIVLKRLQTLLEDPKQNLGLKREAARFLEHQASQQAADLLLHILLKSEEHPLRFLLLQTLLQIKEKNPRIRWNRLLLKGEIVREVEFYQRIRRLYDFYLRSAGGKGEFLEVALKAVSDEGLERIFRCLGLLYPSEVTDIIYQRLVEHTEPDSIRSHAIELLQNLLGPEFYGIVEKILDERALKEFSEEEVAKILEEMIKSPDRWLSLTAHFTITQLGLSERWPKLGSLASAHSFESLDV